MAQGIEATCQDALSVTASQQFPGMANGISARRAGIGDDGDWPVKPKRRSEIQPLPLRLVVQDSARLLPARAWHIDSLPVIILTEAHATARGAEHQGQVIGSRPTGLMPGLVSCQQQHFRRSIHPPQIACPQKCCREHGRQFHLRRHFDPLPGDIE